MPPTITTSAVPRMVIVLTTTENSDCCQVIAMRACIVFVAGLRVPLELVAARARSS